MRCIPLANLATVHLHLEEYSVALGLFQRAYMAYQENNDFYHQYCMSFDMARTYYAKHEMGKALEILSNLRENPDANKYDDLMRRVYGFWDAIGLR